jgi:tetratricopeptide (TPR) repeat protein
LNTKTKNQTTKDERFADKFNRLYAEMNKYYKDISQTDNQAITAIEELLSFLENASASDIETIKPDRYHNAYFCSGYFYMDSKYERAIELFKKAIKIDDKWHSNYINLAICLGKLGKD